MSDTRPKGSRRLRVALAIVAAVIAAFLIARNRPTATNHPPRDVARRPPTAADARPPDPVSSTPVDAQPPAASPDAVTGPGGTVASESDSVTYRGVIRANGGEILRTAAVESITPEGSTATVAEGHFTLTLRTDSSEWRMQRTWMRVTAPGYHGRTATLVVGPGAPTTDRTITMHPLADITGSVTDDLGRAIAGARITAVPNTEYLDRAEAPTDDGGHFRCPAGVGTTLELHVRPPDPADAWADPVVTRLFAEHDPAKPIVLRRASDVSKRTAPQKWSGRMLVVSEDGSVAPVTHAGIVPSGFHFEGGRIARFPRGFRSSLGERHVDFDGVPTGRWRAWVRTESGDIGSAEIDLVNARQDERFTLQVPGSLSVVAPSTGTEGRTATQWTVTFGRTDSYGYPQWVLGGDPDFSPLKVNAEVYGQMVVKPGAAASFERVLPGDYWAIAVSSAGQAAGVVTVTPRAESTLHLSPTTFGTLILSWPESSRPPANVTFLGRVREIGMPVTRRLVVSSRTATITGLPPGSLEWYLGVEDEASATYSVTANGLSVISPGETTRAEIPSGPAPK
jgi:hypothetical protein